MAKAKLAFCGRGGQSLKDVLPEYQKYLLEHRHAGLPAGRQATADGCVFSSEKVRSAVESPHHSSPSKREGRLPACRIMKTQAFVKRKRPHHRDTEALRKLSKNQESA